MSRSDQFNTSVSSALRQAGAGRRRKGRLTGLVVDQQRYGHPWLMQAIVTEQDGRLVVAEVRIIHCPSGHLPGQGPLPQGGLTGGDLRTFSLPEIIDTATSDERWWWENYPVVSHLGPGERDRLREALQSGRGRRRDDDFYGYIAEWYLRALERNPTRPYPIMREVIRRDLDHRLDGPRSRAAHRVIYQDQGGLRNLVRRARDYGWLTRETPNRAGGKATRKLERWRKERATKEEAK